MNDLQPVQSNNPFHKLPAVTGAANVGAISIESERAIAEAQGQMILAKRFPRDLNAAHSEMMMACKSPAFAEVAFYAKPQGGKVVTGPSIRMAEQLAQVVGNFQYGSRELSRDDHKSEVEIFAWDMEKNNYAKRQKTVLHVRDTKEGQKKLRDQTDIDQKINNVASKESRGLIIAMMPKWLVEDAIRECQKTIAGNNDEPIEARVRRMVQAFAKFGVTTEHLEKYLGHKLDKTMIDELVDLTGIHTAMRDGAPPSEFFSTDGLDDTEKPAGVNAIEKAAAAAKTSAAAAAGKAATAPKKPAAASKAAETVSKPAQDPAETGSENGAVAEADDAGDSKPEAAPETVKKVASAPAAAPENQEDEPDVF